MEIAKWVMLLALLCQGNVSMCDAHDGVLRHLFYLVDYCWGEEIYAYTQH